MNTALSTMLLLSWCAGLTAVLGGALAWRLGAPHGRQGRALMHAVVALGGGLLLAAVVFALLPEGMAVLPAGVLLSVFLCGGAAFAVVDWQLSRQAGPRAQLLAMLMDYVPEALSLGATFSVDPQLGLLLALFIGAQNLPEGFNAFHEQRGSGSGPLTCLGLLLALSTLGPLAAFAGHQLLQDAPHVTAGIMTFAGGGVLYLLFQDIAPRVPMRRRGWPPLGAVLGFAIGMAGAQWLG